MNAHDWKALLGLGALALVISFWSEQAAVVFVGTVGLVAVLTHGAKVRGFVGLGA